jgi:hypothetical protein
VSQSGLLKVIDSILPPDVPTSFVGNIGTAIPSLNVLNVLGNNYISTSGSGNTLSIIGNTVTVPFGGTGQTTLPANQLLLGNGTSAVNSLSNTNSATLVSTSSGVPVWSSTMTNGQVIIGSTSGTPTAATLTAGTNVTITNGAGSITINATGGGITWSVVTGSTQAAVANNGYIANNAGTCTITLPATSNVGDTVAVSGMNNATGWKIAQPNAGSVIHFGTATTTTGVSGFLSSLNTYDAVTLVCNTANASWIVIESVGNITVN